MCLPDRDYPSQNQPIPELPQAFSGHRSLAVGIQESIFGSKQSHIHFHCVGTSFVDNRLQRAMNIVFLISSGYFECETSWS